MKSMSQFNFTRVCIITLAANQEYTELIINKFLDTLNQLSNKEYQLHTFLIGCKPVQIGKRNMPDKIPTYSSQMTAMTIDQTTATALQHQCTQLHLPEMAIAPTLMSPEARKNQRPPLPVSPNYGSVTIFGTGRQDQSSDRTNARECKDHGQKATSNGQREGNSRSEA
jgi:hypothetical protein